MYYRLAVFLIRTPALAEHLEDLAPLVDHFLARLGRARPVKRIDDAAIAKLKAHAWPGNVRELEHVLERATILAGDEPVLTADDIDFGTSMGSAGGESDRRVKSSAAAEGRSSMQIETRLSDALSRYLDLAVSETKLTAANMANIDTPGYRTQGFDFDTEMRKALGNGGRTEN